MSVSRTGQIDEDDFDRFDNVNAAVDLSVPASDLGGGTGQTFGQQGDFEGLTLFDLGDILDSDEIGVLLEAEHRLTSGILSTSTADGTALVSAQIASDPDLDTPPSPFAGPADIDDSSGNFNVESAGRRVAVSNDVLGRVLTTISYAPITDGAQGVGGAGTSGTDKWHGTAVPSPLFDVRDQIYVNGLIEQSNVDDASIYTKVNCQWTFGIMDLESARMIDNVLFI